MISINLLSLIGVILLAVAVTSAVFAYLDMARRVRELTKTVADLQDAKKAPVYAMKAGLEDVISYLVNLRRQNQEQALGFEAVNYWLEKAQETALKARSGEYDIDTPTGHKPPSTPRRPVHE